MVKEEQQLQKEQQQKYEEWVREEGGMEHPTHLETLLKPEQQQRIKWLQKHCGEEKDILDIGCSWGYILNELRGKCGIDRNSESIERAKREFPDIDFKIGDVTKGLNIPDKSYDIVIESELLEHLNWFAGVEEALLEGLRIAKDKVLITMPWKKEPDFALCFKHQWVPTEARVRVIAAWLSTRSHNVILEFDPYFVYVEVIC